VNTGLERFAELVSRDQFDLAQASLMLAQDVYPDIDVSAYLGRLDDIAAAIRRRLASDAFTEQKVLALNYYLFDQMRFSGNIDDYYDPRNSYLNEVIERRTGIPITLSILYLEVGRRLGLNLKGAGRARSDERRALGGDGARTVVACGLRRKAYARAHCDRRRWRRGVFCMPVAARPPRQGLREEGGGGMSREQAAA